MAGKIGSEGGAGSGTAEPLIDPLLQSFAERYVHPWERRELGRIDSPLYLVPRLNDAAELFERGRQRWRTLDALSKGGASRGDVLRDFDGEEWSAQRVKAARDTHRLLLPHSSFDLSKPEELSTFSLGLLVGGDVPAAVLYASVAMRCAQDAADECYRLSLTVEECARRWHGVDLAVLHDADNDQWLDCIRDVRRDLAGEEAEAREYIIIYLGAARTALALASAAENAENLDAAERDYVELWQQHEADKMALSADTAASDGGAVEHRYFDRSLILSRSLSPEVVAANAEKARLKKENIDRRENARTKTENATKKRVADAKSMRALVGEKFKEIRAAQPSLSDDKVCKEVAAQVTTELRKSGGLTKVGVHKATVRRHAKALGFLSAGIPEKPVAQIVRNANAKA